MTVVPQQPFAFLASRLASLLESSPIGSDDLLAILNAGYREACQQGRLLRGLARIPLTRSTLYSLPTDWAATIDLFIGGERQKHIPASIGISSTDPGVFYEYTGEFGVPVPLTGTTALLYYSRLPSPLQSLQDDLDPDWMPEWTHLIRHYAAWQVTMISGGAERISSALYQRNLFDQGLVEARRTVDARGRLPAERLQVIGAC